MASEDTTRPPFFHGAFDLVFENLSPDAAQAGVIFAAHTRTGVTEGELRGLLMRFSTVDPLQNHEADPQLVIRGARGRFAIRTQRGRLLFCDLATSARTWTELTADEILREVQAPTSRTRPDRPAENDGVAANLRSRWPVFALLAFGIAVNLFVIVRVVTYLPEPDFVPTGDGLPTRELIERVNGVYTTEAGATFQRITLQEPNQVVFYRYADGSTRLKSTDLYLVGTYKGRPRLITGQNGFIDAPDAKLLRYGDLSYQRAGDK